jgi:uncharacterized glyoxalase superfamily protein PhnB
MIHNRSVPTDILLPHIVYKNVAAAIAWLSQAFGFAEHYRYGNPDDPSGAQMYLGKAYIMVRGARSGSSSPAHCGYTTQSLTVFVDDVEAHYKKAKSAGAKIVEELNQTEYGEFQFGVEDLEGHHWLFARHARDASPEAWGAKLAAP